MDYLKGVCGPKDLSRIIAKLLSLEQLSRSQVAKMRWILTDSTVKRLLKTSAKLFASQPTLLRNVPTPVVCVGDTHGDLHTLLQIIRHNGMPPHTNYLFLGDYVDRGPNGMEVLMLILALAATFPANVFVLRGNHESVLMTRTYGFLDECRRRYSTHIYVAAVKNFNLMPIAAVVQGKVFVTHGGLSPKLESLAQIEAIQRPVSITPNSLIGDLIWGDPTKNDDCPGFSESDRGAGYYFGKDVFFKFLADNDFSAMIRAHETCKRGCRVHWGACWTVFSHPRYMNSHNAAGALVVDGKLEMHPQMYFYDEVDKERVLGYPVEAELEPDDDNDSCCSESVIADGFDEDAEIKASEWLNVHSVFSVSN